MTLREWCANRPAGAVRRLSDACGMLRQNMSVFVNGRATPSLELAIAIWTHTEGEVSLRAILDPHGRLPWPTGLRLFDCDPEVSKDAAALRAAEMKDAKIPRRLVTPGLQAVETRRAIAELVGTEDPDGVEITVERARHVVKRARARGVDPMTWICNFEPAEPSAPPPASSPATPRGRRGRTHPQVPEQMQRSSA